MTASPRTRAIVALVVGTASFALALTLRERFDPWRSTALAAAASIVAGAWSVGPELRERLALPPRAALFAIALGVVLVIATHLAFAVVQRVSPDLAFTIRGLYASIDVGESRIVLTLVTAIVVVAEELIWRGAAFRLSARRPAPASVAAGSVVLYMLPQLASHAPLLVVAAAGLGTLFAVQRHVTGRLTDALLTHLVWSCSVFVLFPLTLASSS